MQSQIWASTLPLHITSPNNPTPYLINFPRQSYLSLLLPRLSVLYNDKVNTFQYESILLKNLPLGLLYDLYGGELPWKLEVVEGPDYKVRDAWLNSLKEAEFLRTGSARGVMSLSRAETESLWDGIVDNDVNAYNAINNKLLNSSTPLKHIPLRVYVPNQSEGETVASFKPIQTLVVAKNDMRESLTIGAALNQMLPSLFPSRRDAVLAEPILHGATVPFRAPLEELMREAAYADGWLHVTIKLLD